MLYYEIIAVIQILCRKTIDFRRSSILSLFEPFIFTCIISFRLIRRVHKVQNPLTVHVGLDPST